MNAYGRFRKIVAQRTGETVDVDTFGLFEIIARYDRQGRSAVV